MVQVTSLWNNDTFSGISLQISFTLSYHEMKMLYTGSILFFQTKRFCSFML